MGLLKRMGMAAGAVALGVMFAAALPAGECRAALEERFFNSKEVQNRDDIRGALEYVDAVMGRLHVLAPSDVFSSLLAAQRRWEKEGVEQDVAYLEHTQPFYDTYRKYAISAVARGIFLDMIADFIEMNRNYSQADAERFFSHIDYVKIINIVASQFSRRPELVEEYVRKQEKEAARPALHCSYRDYAKEASFVSLAGDVIGFFTKSRMASLASNAMSMADKADIQEFQCMFRGSVARYVIGYFYNQKTGIGTRYKEEAKNITMNEIGNGIRFTSYCVGALSNLDYVAIKFRSHDNNDYVYIYKVDKKEKKIVPVDREEFSQKIVGMYGNTYEMNSISEY